MTPLLIGAAITFTISAGFAMAARWLHPYVDERSFMLGEVYLFVSLATAMVAAQVYFALRRAGWTARVSDWLSRIRVKITHDWHTDEHGCIYVDLLRMFLGRNHENGTFQAEVYLVGVGLKVGVMVDREEYQHHQAAVTAQRAEFQEQMRQDIVNMIKSAVPDGSRVSVVGDDDSSVH